MKNLLPAAAVITAGMTSACAFAAEPATPPAPSAKPNIVFILIDDMGWRDVGFMGSKYYDTPNIDRLAAQGMRFNQAYAACAVCSPTNVSTVAPRVVSRHFVAVSGIGTTTSAEPSAPVMTEGFQKPVSGKNSRRRATGAGGAMSPPYASDAAF